MLHQMTTRSKAKKEEAKPQPTNENTDLGSNNSVSSSVNVVNEPTVEPSLMWWDDSAFSSLFEGSSPEISDDDLIGLSPFFHDDEPKGLDQHGSEDSLDKPEKDFSSDEDNPSDNVNESSEDEPSQVAGQPLTEKPLQAEGQKPFDIDDYFAENLVDVLCGQSPGKPVSFSPFKQAELKHPHENETTVSEKKDCITEKKNNTFTPSFKAKQTKDRGLIIPRELLPRRAKTLSQEKTTAIYNAGRRKKATA